MIFTGISACSEANPRQNTMTKNQSIEVYLTVNSGEEQI